MAIEITLSFTRKPNNIPLVEKHAVHIYDFQQLCLKTRGDPEYMDANDWFDMEYESLAMGFLLARDVPVAEAYELTILGCIEPLYPKI